MWYHIFMFLPTTKTELNGTTPDFIMITVDAYVDHPSFGHAIISRLVESEGFSIGIVPQPVTDEDYATLGVPSIAFLVSGGVVDSMVNNYTVAKKHRTEDCYSEGGVVGKIPDRAVTVHTQALKRLFPDTPVIIGGIEASLRRFAHYDYWANRVMPTILSDAPADLLIYGMGENPLTEILKNVKRGVPITKLKNTRGTAYFESSFDFTPPEGAVYLPSFKEVSSDSKAYVKAFNTQYDNSDFGCRNVLIQEHKNGFLVVNPPQFPLDEKAMDTVYALPYERLPHPMYKKGVPAIEEVRFSITSHRGCFGACNYCAITMHQGRIVSKRSKESIVKETELLTTLPDFKGYINDLGGATANFRNTACKKQALSGACKGKSCIGYNHCKNLEVDHSDYLEVLRAVRRVDGVKKVFIRSGIRYDYLMMDKHCNEILKEFAKYHISGQLKVAPEHCSDKVLSLMNKPPFEVYKKFADAYHEVNKELGKEQFVVPYLISSHPGATLDDAIIMAKYLKSINYTPLQVQDFYPTPSTKSTTMYYTGINPDTMQEVYVPRSKEEKRAQRALLQFSLPQNKPIVIEALKKVGKPELIQYFYPKKRLN